MATKAKSAVAKKSHPTYSVMTAEAVKALKERSGSSLPAVTKYITTTYAIDVNKYALNKALRDGVSDGKLIKIKASYKLPATVKEAAPKKKKAAPAAAAAKAAPKVCRMLCVSCLGGQAFCLRLRVEWHVVHSREWLALSTVSTGCLVVVASASRQRCVGVLSSSYCVFLWSSRPCWGSLHHGGLSHLPGLSPRTLV